ncbi:GNAT family N-acetyltransferase [Aridibaculum aurantiacum]|uniref:GNAT family N-acetyltransferase n=1 Tax=Aridibaculum aurantiacum TaxID=2810307 RepID=UPI001A965FB8|nr:GNAT family N-acetyltransferase [Aridibaculum aurantiacum]
MLEIKRIEDKTELVLVQTLFNEYAAELNENLSFQTFDSELAEPLKKYGPPHGSLFIAFLNGDAAGCIALQQLDEQVCEMKRMYVRPSFRKHGIGEALVQVILQDATAKHYHRMVLDTLQRLVAAIRLYRKFGFTETTAYYDNPLPGVVYMHKDLEQPV